MRSGRQIHTTFLLTAILTTSLSERRLHAVDCSTPLPGLNVSQGSVFNLIAGGFTNSELQTAINYWGCPSYSQEIPAFQIGGSGGVPVQVAKIVGNAPAQAEGCGLFDPEAPNGFIESATITVWTNTSTPGSWAAMETASSIPPTRRSAPCGCGPTGTTTGSPSRGSCGGSTRWASGAWGWITEGATAEIATATNSGSWAGPGRRAGAGSSTRS